MRKPSHKTNPHLIDLIRQLKELDANEPLNFIIMTESIESGQTNVYSTCKDPEHTMLIVDDCYDFLIKIYDL